MASGLKDFAKKVTRDTKQLAKLFKSTAAGGRILPTRTPKHDVEFQCRVDMGEEIQGKPGFRNVYLQVNSQAKSPGLKNWLAKNPHGKLATAEINMNTPEDERDEEGARVINKLVEDGKNTL